MKYYVVLMTSRLGYSMRTNNFTRVLGAYGYAKATKLVSQFSAEQSSYYSYNADGTIESITRWTRINEKQYRNIVGE